MKKYLFYIISIILFLIISIYAYKINDKDFSRQSIIEEKSELIKTKIYKFTSNDYNLNKIKLKLNHTKNNEEKGNILLKLYDSENKIVVKQHIPMKKINYDNSYVVKFSKINSSFNKNYKLVLENKTNIKKIDIENIELYNFNGKNRLYFIITVVLLTLITSILIYIFESKNINIEKSYLILATIVYGAFIIFFPLFTAHDELYHWFRSYEISEGKMTSGIYENKALSLLPSSVVEIHNANLHEINYRTVKDSYKVQNTDNRIYTDMSTVAVYSPVQYLPQATGIFIARLFTNRTLIMAYFGRLFNALLAIILIYLSIKIIPFGKRILFTIAFFPIAVEGFTSLSADAITVSVSIFFLSYILRLIYDKSIKKLNKKDYILISLLSIVIAFCKVVYIPLILICFLIPKSKFSSTKKYLISCSTLFTISLLCNLAWLRIASKYLALYATSGIKTSFVLKHPFNFIEIIIYTFFTNSKEYLFTMLGEELGWEDIVHVISIVPIGYLILILMNSLFDKKAKNKLNWKINTMFAVVSMCIIGLIFTSLYVQFTTPGNIKVAGVQGRYFLPILPLILLLFANVKAIYSDEIKLEKITINTSLILSYCVISTLFICFL